MNGVTKRSVTLSGIRPIMFDPYSGDNKTELTPEEKFYFEPGTTNLVLPSENIMSFLSAENTESAPKQHYDLRKYKSVARACKCYVSIDEWLVPLKRKGKQIKFEGFGENGITIHKSVARLAKGIPNPKERPMVDAPWSLSFGITIIENDVITERDIKTLFEKGGVSIGLGTYRGVFGKFVVDNWK